MITKIISGGQTGAGRAALDFATENDITHGGWIPKGRKTEDGNLPEKYRLQEMLTGSYPKRTKKNILNSDGSIIFSRGKLTSGPALTQKLAKHHNKPWVHLDLNQMNEWIAADIIKGWIKRHEIQILNVAGTRASKDPGIYDIVVSILKRVFNEKNQ